MKVFVALTLILAVATADMYLHNPRGSNCRLNEANNNRNNANRLMDTQNNAKGGYCVGPAMTYYEGSLLTVEWTNQHGCGNPKLWCSIVLQYACSRADALDRDIIRDGQTTDTIPDGPNAQQRNSGVEGQDGGAGLEYGMHEPQIWWTECETRDRNLGLWISDREDEGNLNAGRAAARFTRQDNNGNRHGFECNEERDYYPYWRPSIWRDIAVFVQSESECGPIADATQNTNDAHRCEDPATGQEVAPNNEGECEASGFDWVDLDSSWDISAPECLVADFSRDNHLGNGAGIPGHNNVYNWTMPTSDDEGCIDEDGPAGIEGNCNCVFRIRYNISTGDMVSNDDPLSDQDFFDNEESFRDLGSDGNSFEADGLDSSENGLLSPIRDDVIMTQDGLPHQLALDTTQYGRTFEDRSHVWHLRPRPGSVEDTARIFNLNVRGKRGNIVQTYPATEYDFVPSYLYIRSEDYVHWQWTGCDTNPAGNAGEGTASTDRSNVVQLEAFDTNLPASEEWLDNNPNLFTDEETRIRMAYLGQEELEEADGSPTCLDYQALLARNGNNQGQAEQDVRNCMKLNAAPTPYFDGGLVQHSSTDNSETHFHYMASRNNNFTNRGQKAVLIVQPLLETAFIIVLAIGGCLCLVAFAVAGVVLYAKHTGNQGILEKLEKF